MKLRGIFRERGFVQRWLDFCAPYEYPESYAAFSILVAASAAINGRILINAGFKPETCPNLFVLLYGPTGARKSEALMDATVDILAGSEATHHVPILPMNSTPEALRNRLVKDSRCDPHADELECDREEHTGKARGVLISEEFTMLVGGADYQKHSADFLGKLWETPRPYETFATIAHGEQVIRNRYVVLGCCTTPDKFAEIDFSTLEGNLMRRLIVVSELGEAKEAARPRRNTMLLSALRDEFGRRLGFAAFDSTCMALSAGAVRLNDEWYVNDLRRLRKEVAGAKAARFVNSLQVHAFKLGAVIHVLEGGDPEEMSEESLRMGFALVEALLPGVLEVYQSLAPTPLGKLKARIVRAIAAAGPGGIEDARLDTGIGAEMGIDHEAVSRARRQLIAENRVHRNKEGRMVIQ